MNNKRKAHKPKKPARKEKGRRKTAYELISIPAEVIFNEPKIVITGDYLIEFYNHKGIIDITDTKIKINTKKAIYIVNGAELFICEVTDEEIKISGRLISLEREG